MKFQIGDLIVGHVLTMKCTWEDTWVLVNVNSGQIIRQGYNDSHAIAYLKRGWDYVPKSPNQCPNCGYSL